MEKYRSVLEVLKLSCASDVLLYCREVSCLWATAGLCNELWDYYSDYCLFPARYPSESGLQAYVRGKCQGFKLPLYKEGNIEIYDCLTGLKEHWSSSLSPPHMSCWVYYHGFVISTGGAISQGIYSHCHASAANYIFNQIGCSQLNNMQTPRYRHAAIIFQSELLVFGGISADKDLQSAEKLNVKQVARRRNIEWNELPPSAKRRKDFTLCCDLQHVYLCGAAGIEQFTPQNNAYQIIQLSLPFATCYNAMLIGKELLVLADSEAIWVQLGSAVYTLREIREKRVQRTHANVVTMGSYLYWLADKVVRRLEISTIR